MSRFKLVAMIALPSLNVLSGMLRTTDADDFGPDDEIANAIDLLVARLSAYLAKA